MISQKQPTGEWRPVAYQSRSLAPTEQRYSQIEKEALAITWACERFSHFVLGLTFHIQTDHKPLIPLLSTKALDELPPRVLRFRLRLMRYHFSISHVPGKDLITADALSRAPISSNDPSDQALLAEVASMVAAITNSLPASDQRLTEICTHQAEDDTCRRIITYCKNGWPDKHCLPDSLKPYWSYRGELTLSNDQLLLCGQRIVIPDTQRLKVLEQLHTGHQGITKCRERAKQSVWWPGLSRQLAEYVTKCVSCAQMRQQNAEPLLPSEMPTLPWQKLAADFFEYKSREHLLVVDYYSRFIEIALLSTMTSTETIRHLRSIFARHGIPDELRTDNGRQFTSQEFQQFMQDNNIRHTTSSPLFPQANGMAERAVKTAKRLIRSSSDPYTALLAYRATPLENGYSPAQLLFGRRIKTTVPITLEQRRPKLLDTSKLLDNETHLKSRQKKNFDSHHPSRSLSPLPLGSFVFLPDRQESGQVTSGPSHRSYIISTPSGEFRRNRRHINPLSENLHNAPNELSNTNVPEASAQPTPDQPQATTQQPSSASPAQQNPGQVVTRSGRVSHPPKRLVYGRKGRSTD